MIKTLQKTACRSVLPNCVKNDKKSFGPRISAQIGYENRLIPKIIPLDFESDEEEQIVIIFNFLTS